MQAYHKKYDYSVQPSIQLDHTLNHHFIKTGSELDEVGSLRKGEGALLSISPIQNKSVIDVSFDERPKQKFFHAAVNKLNSTKCEQVHFYYQQNKNFSNNKPQSKNKVNHQQKSKQLNQKQILQKVNRINRLNEQIHSRLQRMLAKVQRHE